MSSVKRGIRNDKLRKLFDTAVKQGWTAEVDGAGHVKLTDPRTLERFQISTTAGGHRSYLNTRAQAKRAGLDVGAA